VFYLQNQHTQTQYTQYNNSTVSISPTYFGDNIAIMRE